MVDWLELQLRRCRNQWPLLLVLVCLAGSCLIISTGHWRRGAFAFACTVALAGLLRLVLPSRVAGLLTVRSRWMDVLLLLAAATGLVLLTLVVPPSPPPSQR